MGQGQESGLEGKAMWAESELSPNSSRGGQSRVTRAKQGKKNARPFKDKPLLLWKAEDAGECRWLFFIRSNTFKTRSPDDATDARTSINNMHSSVKFPNSLPKYVHEYQIRAAG